MPGPPPKRDEERRRRNKPEDGVETTKVNLDELIAQEVEIPVENEDWDELTKQFYRSFSQSGQAIWYEPSDWMTIYGLMEVLDRWLKPQEVKVGERDIETQYGEADEDGEYMWRKTGKDYLFEQKIVAMPGGVLTAILKGLTALMATEGDRRRLRIELERKKALDAALGGDGVVVPITQSREEAFKRARAAGQQGT